MVPVKELAEVADGVLADSTALAKLTAGQVRGLAEKVGDMTEENMQKFVDNVADPLVEESITAIGALSKWADEQASEKGPILLGAAERTWGAVDTWQDEQLDKLDNLVAQIPVEDLKKISKEARSSCELKN